MHTHKRDSPYKCKKCNSSFTHKSHLKTHMHIHNRDRPYKCKICKSLFAQKYSLKIHMSTHIGQRPYKCDLCNSSFVLKNTFQIHIRTHTKERTYKCEVCNSSFTHKSHIKTHMRIHNEDRIRIGIYKHQWSRIEKYILLWAMQYSQQKNPKANEERTRTFSEIFYTRCQYKHEFDPRKRSTVKKNILKSNIFTTLELENMKVDVAREIQVNTPIDQINIGIPQKQEETIQGNLPDFMIDK